MDIEHKIVRNVRKEIIDLILEEADYSKYCGDYYFRSVEAEFVIPPHNSFTICVNDESIDIFKNKDISSRQHYWCVSVELSRPNSIELAANILKTKLAQKD